MRKLSLDDGRLSLDIVPDCGGGLSALRWLAPAGQPIDLLCPASVQEIAARNPARMSCVPMAFLNARQTPEPAAPWTVQDASNVRATLTLHHETAQQVYQILQRFELYPNGLHLQLTLTNIGARPLPVGIGLRLRPALQEDAHLRGALIPLDRQCAISAAQFAQGYPLTHHSGRLFLHHAAHEIYFAWPQHGFALSLLPDTELGFLEVDTRHAQQEIPVTLLSDRDAATPSVLKQGDSLSALLILSAGLIGGGGRVER